MQNREEEFEKQRDIVRRMNIMDDDLFHKVVEDTDAMEEILSVLLQQKELKLLWSRPQVHLRNSGTRSVRLDALCESGEGILINVEMEKSNNDDHQKRVRYNSSNIDTLYTEKGVEFKDIPELYMIYLTSADVFQGNRTVYHVNRVVEETGERVENGMHEIYINARVDDGTEIARMMQYFKETRGEDSLFPRVSRRIRYLKEEQKGVEEMRSEAVEEYARERAKREAKEVARDNAVCLFKNGADFEMVASSIHQLTREELLSIYHEVV